ncbi:MAG: FapA family protein [Treponema sp.]|jgi:uncharacterized protein (DUF342 family)|nr:FapA family protein [Treponema sp.]
MVDFVGLQYIVKEQLKLDRTIRTVEVTGPTIEDAVSQAATLLDLPVRRIEYELVERGSGGFFGSGKKDWKIRVYEQVSQRKNRDIPGCSEEDKRQAHSAVENKPGEIFVRLTDDGAFLKVTSPKGKGKRPTEAQARLMLEARNVKDMNDVLVAKTINDAEGVYVRVGDFDHNPINDSTVSVDILDQEMKAVIVASPPGPGGCDITPEYLIKLLRDSYVVHGIKTDFLQDFADKPVYRHAVVAAEASYPVNGRDAYIQYNFETDQSKIHIREDSNGRVDFKDLNIIKNVVENQPLARKIPAEWGSPGSTVTAKAIPAKSGKDIPLPVGKNVHVGNDGVTIIADINGQVVLAGGKINVEPVHTVQGGVNLKTGNIIFLGTVIINGNVEDGFSVKAAGNIEVNGTVEKAELDAEGDVIVHQGITGKGGGIVRAGHSVWARFIENSLIEAGNMVVVSDGIVNSQVDAFKRIVCQGKRAHIVGGRLRAMEEINAKIIGSPMGGTETFCEVGIDPQKMNELAVIMENNTTFERELEEVQASLRTLANIKKQRKSLPEDKEARMNELMDKQQGLMTNLKKNNDEINKIQEYLNSLTVRGRISASSRVYPGVKIVIRDFKEDVRQEYKAVTFVLEENLVMVKNYEEPGEEVKRGPDVHSAN